MEEAEAMLLGLHNMIDELSDAGDVPPDLKDRFCTDFVKGTGLANVRVYRRSPT